MGTRGDTWARGETRGWLGAGAGPRASRAARACACRPQRRGRGDAAASDLHEKGDARQGCVRHVRGLRSGRTDRERREETPCSKVASAPWAPMSARACTGRAATEARPTRGRRHRAAGRLSTALAPAEATCRGEPACRGGWREQGGHAPYAVPQSRRGYPPAAPTVRLDPF